MAGIFTTPSLRQLKSEVNVAEARAKLPGTLRVREMVSDVSVLHTEPQNKYAVFQAASQFNCLEFISERVTPEKGIACYARDPTQGPACATACAPGTVVRNYFGLDGKGQSKDVQIENLKECEELLDNARHNYFRVVGGYTLSSDEKLVRLSRAFKENPTLCMEFRDALRIGVQQDTEVTGSKFGRVQYTGPQQLVTQAYCSACSVSYSGGKTENWEVFSTLVLEASYEATMYVALQNALRHAGAAGSKKLFLTAVGGGVFGNLMPWITHAMSRAFDEFRGIGLEVIIVSYGRSEKALESVLGDWNVKEGDASS